MIYISLKFSNDIITEMILLHFIISPTITTANKTHKQTIKGDMLMSFYMGRFILYLSYLLFYKFCPFNVTNVWEDQSLVPQSNDNESL